MGFNKFDKGRGGRGGFGGGGGNFGGGGRRFGGRNDGPKQMFPATCSQCGNACEVPFKPTGERPVFCHNCFKSQQGGGSNPRFAPKSFGGGNRNASIGNNFGGGSNTSTAVATVTKAQFDSLNVKLDKILTILNSAMVEEAVDDDYEIKPKKETVKKEKKAPAKKAKAKKK